MSPVSYRIEFAPRAEKDFKKLPRSVQKQIASKIDVLQSNPRPQGVKKLSGEDDLYRIRSGDYRIVYQIQDAALVVLLVKIGHRREVYSR